MEERWNEEKPPELARSGPHDDRGLQIVPAWDGVISIRPEAQSSNPPAELTNQKPRNSRSGKARMDSGKKNPAAAGFKEKVDHLW
jgi:hypothetical protein